MATFTHSPNEVAATWTHSPNEVSATFTQTSGETASTWLGTELMQYGFIFWEGVGDKYEDIVSGYYAGLDATSAKWEDLG